MTGPRASRPTAIVAAGLSLYPELLAAATRVDAVAARAFAALGLPSIDLSLRPDATLAPRDLRLGLDGSDAEDRVDVAGLPAGAIVVRSSPLHVVARFKVPAEAWADPEDSGRRAALIRGTTIDAVDPALGAIALDPVGAAAAAIGAWARRFAEDTVTTEVGARLLSQLAAHDAAALLETCGIDAVTAVLVALVAEGIPVHALSAIAPLLANEARVSWVEPGTVTAAYPGRLLIAAPRPDALAARRLVIARAVAVPLALRRRAGAEPLQAWVLDEVPDAKPAGLQDDAYDALLAERTDGAATVAGAIIVTASAIRAEVARRLRRHRPGMMVVAAHELPRGVRVQRRARIVVPPPPHPSTSRG